MPISTAEPASISSLLLRIRFGLLQDTLLGFSPLIVIVLVVTEPLKSKSSGNTIFISEPDLRAPAFPRTN
ncbi:MAG: hypothetical protein R2883_00530 [Caldisericia bacterium]